MKIEIYKTALFRGCFSRAAILQVVEEVGDPSTTLFGTSFWFSTVPQSKEDVVAINKQAEIIADRVNAEQAGTI